MRYPVNYIYISQGFSSGHHGIDLGWSRDYGGKNQPIYAVDDGEVIYKQVQTNGGYVLHIRHNNGFVSEYGHLKAGSWLVNVGDNVIMGQHIADMGATGNVTGNHLHFGLYQGTSINYNVNHWVNAVDNLFAYPDQTVNSRTDQSYNINYATDNLLRHGTYGNYYGNLTTGSQALTQTQMELNAQYIYRALTHEGWSLSAICGLLGNMQYESSINPGRWQSDDVGNTSMGYGLVQWTPATKYINWVGSGKDYSTMDNNLARIEYEVSNNIQYIASTSYPTPSTFREYTLSPLNPYFLACVFAWNYERSWVVLYGTEEEKEALRQKRGGAANYWYEYLSGVDPGPGPEPPEQKKKKGYNFVLFNRRRRIGHG